MVSRKTRTVCSSPHVLVQVKRVVKVVQTIHLAGTQGIDCQTSGTSYLSSRQSPPALAYSSFFFASMNLLPNNVYTLLAETHLLKSRSRRSSFGSRSTSSVGLTSVGSSSRRSPLSEGSEVHSWQDETRSLVETMLACSRNHSQHD